MIKKEIHGIMVSFLIISVLHIAYYQSVNEYQGILRSLSSLILLFLAIYYCIHLYKTRPTKDLFHFFPAWITAAVIYYFSLNLILFVSANYVFRNASTEVA